MAEVGIAGRAGSEAIIESQTVRVQTAFFFAGRKFQGHLGPRTRFSQNPGGN